MIVHRARGPALAALFFLACSPGFATPAARLQPALQRSFAEGASRAVDRLDAALAQATPLQAAGLALPEGRAALARSLQEAGLSEEAQRELVPGIVAAAREASMAGMAWTEPLVDVGSYQLSLQDLRFVAGPREGRDRRDVLARLALVTAGDGVAHEDARSMALVAQLVAASEAAEAPELLSRLQHALSTAGEEQ